MSNEKEMIKSLTEAQIAKFPYYVKEWVGRGHTTKQMTQEEAEKDFTAFQIHILKKEKPAPVVLLGSPRECWVLIELVKSNENYDLKNMKKDIAAVFEGKKIKSNKENIDFVWPYFDCQFWASYFSYFDFFKNECGITYNENYEIMKKTTEYGMVFPIDEVCIVCQPFTTIRRNQSGLHCINGPAVSYTPMYAKDSDRAKSEVYALNGVRMKKEYVMTPAEDIKAEDILKETNVEVRRELLRKVGIEAMLKALPHKLMDAKDDYELFSIELSAEVKDARYLKMTNPSIGVYHMEAVGPECNTVQDAIDWRAQQLELQGKNWEPEILT